MSGLQGVILTGGQSRRMGRDKSLLQYGEMTFADRIARSMSELCEEIMSIGPKKVCTLVQVRHFQDITPNCGPAGGIHTALTKSMVEWNLVVSCDTPLVSPELFADMLNAYDGHDALICETSGGIHPLVGIYHKNCAKTFGVALQKGKFKVLDILNDLNVKRWKMNGSMEAELRNINTPYDYESLINEAGN